MCGIIGTLGTPEPGRFEAALARIAHRGPDGKGSVRCEVAGKTVWFGHTRLSIQDLSPAGAQPMASRDGRWLVTFNGEIYNHLRLRTELPGPFRGHADTETLVEGLAANGIDAWVRRCEGIFAFAALDVHEAKLYLARDPFGIKPLYYSKSRAGFSFASEVRALRTLLDRVPDIDGAALQAFLTLRYTPSPATLFSGICRLAPGHLLKIDLANGTEESECFTEPARQRFTGSLDAGVKHYERVLSREVEDQLLSDVEIGVMLSGGIDSALVAALAKQAGRALPCYSVGMAGEHAECELGAAEETAKILGLPFFPVRVTPEEMWSASSKVFESVEEPLGTTSTLLAWSLVQRASQDVTVLLSGQGSDEPWGGYKRYQAEIVRQLLPDVAWRSLAPLRRLPLGALGDVLARGVRALPIQELAARFEEEYALFSADERNAFTGNSADGGVLERISFWLDWDASPDAYPVERMMRIDTRMNLADDLLLYSDKISMAFSVELRVPMLGRRVVEFIESLPLNFRVRRSKTKILHKEMAERFLPRAVIDRPKKNFQLPFATWSRSIWRERLGAVLVDAGSPLGRVLDPTAVRRLWNAHQRGQDRSRQVFALWALANALSATAGAQTEA